MNKLHSKLTFHHSIIITFSFPLFSYDGKKSLLSFSLNETIRVFRSPTDDADVNHSKFSDNTNFKKGIISLDTFASINSIKP